MVTDQTAGAVGLAIPDQRRPNSGHSQDVPVDNAIIGNPRARRRRRRAGGIWRAVSYVGYVLMMLGVVTLLFVVYTLFGTRLVTARAQAELEKAFDTRTALADIQPPEPDYAAMTAAMQAEWDVARADGETGAIARIEIPKIGLDAIVVAGTSRVDLRQGPGAMVDTSLPGTAGNSAISAHRSSYGGEFRRINELEPGDQIIVTTINGVTVYEFRAQEIVQPDTIEVAFQRGANELTLTSCDPVYSAATRIITYADMVSGPFMNAPPPLPQPIEREIDSIIAGGI